MQQGISHQIFSIMPMFVCLFWSILLLIDTKQNLPKRYLAFFLSLSFINYFTHATFFNHQYAIFAFMDNLWVFTSLAAYPLYYYYIRLLTIDVKIQWRWSWIALPAIFLSIFSFVIYFRMSPSELHTFIHDVMYHENNTSAIYSRLIKLQILRTDLFKLFFFIQVIVSVYCSYKLIIRYNRTVRAFYSNTGGKDLSPVKWVLFAFVFASFISLTSNMIGKDYFINHNALLAIPSITHSLFLFFIGYVGYKQDFTVVHFAKDVKDYKIQKVQQTTIAPEMTFTNDATQRKLKTAFFSLFEKEMIFKNPELRITDIALILGTNRTYISRIVNEEFHTNFCDFVNSYRINYAEKLLTMPDNKNCPLSFIAEQAGFLSESSFYRVFKNKKGISPGSFKTQL